MSVIIRLDSRGEVHDLSFCESVVRVRHNLSYVEAEAIIEGKDDTLGR